LDGLDDEKESRRRLGEAGFERPDAAYGVLRDIVRLRFLPDSLARYAAHVERMLPRLLYGMSRATDPDRAITQLGRFMVSIGPKAGFLVLLEENPRLIDLLAVLFSQSDLLAGVLIRHPAILDSLVDRRSAALVKSRADLAGELDQMLGPEDDLEAALLVIRRFRNDELLRVGLYDLLDKITWDQVQTQLADLAELILDRTMVLAARQVLPGRAPSDIPLSVLGLGKMGGRELWYGSDLDLIFVLDPEGDLPIESAVRLAQRLISYLSLHLDAGPGYSIDSRLRPSGGQGPLVVTADSFGRYHETSQLWERQALIKLRPVWGPEGLGDRVMALASRAVYDRGLPSDAAAQIHRIRHRMTKERAKLKLGQISLKFSPGGVVDAEFLTQYLQLTHGREHPGPIRSTRTRSALEALARAGFGPPGLARVAEAYPFLSHFSGRLGLSYDRSGDRAVYRPEEIDRIHPPLSGGSAARALERAMAQVAEAYALVFGGAQNGSGERP
jgi:glutamate-ammonia-ligase adenylyltransferase